MHAFAARAETAGCSWILLKEHHQADEGQRVAFFESLGFRRLVGEDQERLWSAEVAHLR
jgi:hypothetical protein